MKLKGQITFILLLTIASSQDTDDENERSRKHYGLSYHANCRDYLKTFTCLSACKSIGFQVFRLDFSCKCSCHELKTTTFLPFFKWQSNGTTRIWAKTFSPELYHIIGTLSPATDPDYSDHVVNATTNAANVTASSGSGSTSSNSGNTSSDSGGTSTNSTSTTGDTGGGDSGNPTTTPDPNDTPGDAPGETPGPAPPGD